MKTALLLFIASITLLSCSKKYHCECETAQGTKTFAADYNSEKKAKQYCDEASSSSVTCQVSKY